MKKFLLLILISLCFITTGCTKQKDFEHYSLLDKDLNIYTYFNNNHNEMYALADLTPEDSEDFKTGLFYKVANNDYILLEIMESDREEAYKKNYLYQFYGNKLYGIGRGESPMVFEIELNGKQSKMNEIKYSVDGKINPFLIEDIKKVSDGEILYYGSATIDGKNSSALINCLLSTHECTISSYE